MLTRYGWLAGLVVGCAITGCQRSSPGMDGFPLTSRVLALVSDSRPYQARFDDGQRHSRCAEGDTTSLIPAAACARVPAAVVRGLAELAPIISEAIRKDPSADALWAAAVLDLASSPTDARQLDRVISRLSEVRARDTTLASPLNHRAIAHLARASIRGDARDLFAALDDIERAYALDSSSLAVRFNRPLIHTLIKTHRLASRGWESSVGAERDDAWRAEGSERARTIPRPPARTVSLRSAEGVARDPQGAREFVLDSLLPEWAKAQLHDNSPGVAPLAARLATVGAAMVSRNGDSSVAHIAADIRREHESAVARGVLALVEGTRHYRLAGFLAAEEALGTAIALLDGGAAYAIADWARLLLGACQMNRQRFDEAIATLDGIGARAAARDDVALEARSLWARAIAVGRRGSLDDAETSFLRAESLFTGIGEARNAALLGTAIADVQGLTGRSMEAANSAFGSYTASVRAGSAVRHEDLIAVAHQLGEQGKPYAAAHLLEETVLGAATSDRVKDLPEALGRLALVEASLGGQATPLATIAEARQAAERVTDAAMRARLDAELDRAEARVIAGSDPQRALALVESARRRHFASIPVDDAALLLAGARLALQLGDSSEAARDLALAVQKVRGLAPKAQGQQARNLVATLRDAHRTLIELALARADTASAFAHTVSLASIASAAGPRHDAAPGVLSPDGGETRLVVLADRVLTWMRVGNDRALSSATLSRGELTGRIARFVNVVHSGDDTLTVRRLGGQLYHLLLGAHEGLLRRMTTLDVHADGVLAGLPLAVLTDEKGQWLAERLATRYVVASVARKRPPQKSPGSRPLMVGNPAWQRSDFPGLEALRWADEEIRQIGDLYPDKSMLSGSEATRGALLEQMPAHSLVHFAGHSRIVMVNPVASHMVLATGRSFQDGVLYASDVARLPLSRVKTVVLSSCGRTYEDASSESYVNGLAIAFLDAGVGAVVASLWEASDEGQMHLMVALHTALVRGAQVEEALRLAQVEMLRSQWRDRLGAASIQLLTGVRAE